MVVLDNKIKEIIKLIHNKEFNKAYSIKESIKKSLNKEINFYINGLIKFGQKNYDDSIDCLKNSISENKNYIPAYLKLSEIFEKNNNLKKSEEYLRGSLLLNNESDIIYNSLGYNLFKQNKFEESLFFLKKSTSINNQNFKSFFNLGNVHFKLNNFNEAIKNFKKAIEINFSIPEANFNIAECYKKLTNYKEAYNFYMISLKEKNTWLRKEKITAKILEIYLILNQKDNYVKDILALSKQDPNNRRIAATSAFISHQFNIDNHYPFCPKPLDYIYLSTLKEYTDDYELFLKAIINEILSLDFSWDPAGNTTRNGLRTTENISEKKFKNVEKLENFILEEIKKYYRVYKDQKITFIQNWPKKFRFQSWSNRLKRHGHNITHIHPGGWISGVFYLKIPKDIQGAEAGIEFSLHGDDYYIYNKNIPNKLINPKDGDIVFFPSSLFHKTIPFESDEERIVIAFDLCPV